MCFLIIVVQIQLAIYLFFLFISVTYVLSHYKIWRTPSGPGIVLRRFADPVQQALGVPQEPFARARLLPQDDGPAAVRAAAADKELGIALGGIRVGVGLHRHPVGLGRRVIVLRRGPFEIGPGDIGAVREPVAEELQIIGRQRLRPFQVIHHDNTRCRIFALTRQGCHRIRRHLPGLRGRPYFGR